MQGFHFALDLPRLGSGSPSAESQLRVLDELPIPSWRAGVHGAREWFNRSWLAFSGRTLEQEAGDGWTEAVHPEDRAACLESYHAAVRARTHFEIEYRLLRHDGVYRWMVDAGKPFHNPDGTFAGYLGACHDVTERRHWEDVGRRYQLLSENARDIVLFVRQDGRILEANRAAEQAYLFSREELLGMTIQDLRAPETHEELQGQMQSADDRGLLFETVHRRRGGVTFPVEVNSQATWIGDERILLSIVRDISDRKRAEAALRMTKFTLDKAVEAVFWVQADGRLVYVNEAACRHLGYSREELLEMTVSDFDPTRPADEWPRQWEDVVARGSLCFETRHRRKDGSERAVEITTNLVEYEGRQINCAFVRDITLRKESEQALHHAHEMVRALVESSPLAIVGLDCQGRVRTWNPAATRIFGWEEPEVIGRPYPLVNPLDEADFRTFFDMVVHGTAITEREVRRVTKDGRMVDVCVCAAPTRMGDEVDGIVAVLADVTERKLAEQRIRRDEAMLAEAQKLARLSSCEIRLPEGDLLWSPEMHSIIGLGPRHRQASVADLLALVHPEERGAVEEAIRSAPARGQTFDLEFRMVLPDGSLRHIASTLNPVPEKRGPGCRIFVVLMDVTERKSLEEQLRHAQRMEAVGRLAGGLAHDFNNLLMVINGHSYHILETIGALDPLRESMTEVTKAGERAAALIRQLLAFSRRQPQRAEVTDLNGVIGEIEKMLRRLIGEDVRLVTSLDPGLGRVRVDPSQLQQVIMNLVVNARDAMPEGGRLVIRTSNVDLDDYYARQHVGVEQGPHVLLAVSDTGVGMDARTRARIFEPFFTTKQPGKGTGLGLATVYGIVQQSGGHISVLSEPGRGTSFRIYLPRVRAAATAAAPASRTVQPFKGHETILLVEDEAPVRGFLRHALTTYGYKVVEAGDAAQALNLCERYAEPIHLLLTDLVMPGMDGTELTHRVEQLRPGIRVLCMSGYPDRGATRSDKIRAEENFISKPFTALVLCQKIRSLLDGAPAEDTPKC